MNESKQALPARAESSFACDSIFRRLPRTSGAWMIGFELQSKTGQGEES